MLTARWIVMALVVGGGGGACHGRAAPAPARHLASTADDRGPTSAPAPVAGRPPAAVAAAADASAAGPAAVGARQRTALHEAAYAGDLAAIDRLVAAGADLEAVETVYQATPLLLALEFAKHDAARRLLDAGASVAGTVGPRALALAARSSDAVLVAALRGRGATVAGSFALHAAARWGDRASVEAVLTAGAVVDEVEPDDGWTPLMIAAMSGNAGAVDALLAAGATVGLRDGHRRTALHWAVFAERPTEVHRYPRGGGPHDTYWIPRTAAPITAALIGHHAALDAVDDDGNTALHDAAMFDARAAAALLLAAGARTTLRNRAGATPAQLARARNNSVAPLLAP
ncbi:MAG: ankyrin repeat domain-containing protein [Kofleriaceae bacterium]